MEFEMYETKINLKTETKVKDGNIELKTYMDSNFNNTRTLINKKLIDMQDEAIKNALIALGWTPPKDKK